MEMLRQNDQMPKAFMVPVGRRVFACTPQLALPAPHFSGILFTRLWPQLVTINPQKITTDEL
jgi:hypothetical protein